MKKPIYLFCILLQLVFSQFCFSQPLIHIGIFEATDEYRTLEIRVKSSGDFQGLWSSCVFTLRWLTSNGVTLETPSGNFGMVKDGAASNSGLFTYQKFNHNNINNVNWVNGQEIVVMKISYAGGIEGSSEIIELVNDNWTITNGGQHYEELGGVDRTGSIYVSSATVSLPIELIELRAKPENETVIVSWTTISEINCSYFDVEHSPTGNSFSSVGHMKSKNQLQEPTSYSFSHGSPIWGSNYYRLKTINTDNTYSYSNIVNIELENKNITISPNPLTDKELTIRFNKNIQHISSIFIFDASGKTVWNKNDIPNGVNQVIFPALNIQSGSYLIKIQTLNNLPYYLKFIVTH